MLHKIRLLIPLAVAITGLSVLVFGAIQQLNRMMAYDPQIQVAQDISDALNSGVPPQAITGRRQINISKSLATFVILYDENGKPIVSSAVLNGKTPVPPSGVFAYTKNMREDRLTWQPADDVRIATIIVKYDHGYVLAGRNMREVEARIAGILQKIIAGWAFILVATFIATLIFTPEQKHKKS